MAEDDQPRRKDSTEIVRPYARIRIIVAVIVIVVGLGFLIVRTLLS